jgi:HAD superfamily hydrolase (TIGR01490 family)
VTARSVFFDLDGTLLRGSTAQYMTRELVRRQTLPPSAVATYLRYDLLYRLNRLTIDEVYGFGQSVLEQTGLGTDEVDALVHSVVRQDILPSLFRHGIDLLREHQRSGHAVVLCTAGPMLTARPVAEALGMDDVLANTADWLTSDLPLCFGPGKVDHMRRWASDHGYDLVDCYAYSDSRSDLPMLEAVGRPRAVNPQWTLRIEAVKRGWPVLHFHA